MERTFVETDEFTKTWKSLKLNDDILIDIQQKLIYDSTSGDLIEGTGGARKLRFQISGNRGKSSGGRLIYYDNPSTECIILLFTYTKNQQENLTDTKKKEIKNMIKNL